MCGRFVSVIDPDGLARFFVVDDRQAHDLPPSWNVAPTDEVYAVVEHERRRHLVTFRWGLIPHWADDPRVAARHINARAETLTTKPAFRDAFRRRRCLIPADGFYEWTPAPDGGPPTPHFIHRADRTPLAFAGLWAVWHASPDAEPVRTCTIVTTAANRDVAPLHDRMPVVLPADAWPLWLDRDERATGHLQALLLPSPADSFVHHPVSTQVNHPRNNHPGLIVPVA